MMRLIIFMILSGVFALNSFAQNGFNFNIFARTGEEMDDLKIHFVVTDPLGRRTGYLPEPGITPEPLAVANLEEIPEAFYSTERLGDEEKSDVGSGESIQFYSQPVIIGTYTLAIFAFGDTTYHINFEEYLLLEDKTSITFEGFMSSGTISQYILFIDPTKPIPPKPFITKVVTFQTLRDDFNVAYKLNQIGDDKFVKSLIRMVDIAEMISKRCDNINDKAKPKCYRPVVVILRMIVKRLEVVNRLCDNQTDCKPKCKVSKECDEDEALKMFKSKYRKDKDLTEFFDSWDKDEWHKHKKKCKRFITDEALEIISADVNWLIKSFGEEVFDNYKKEHEPYIPEKYKNFFK